MKLKMKAGDLLAALELVGQTVDKNKKDAIGSSLVLLDVYKNEKGEAAYLYSTNAVAELSTRVKCTVEVAGRSLIDPDQLRAGLSYRAADLDVEIELVTSGKGKSQVNRLQVTVGENKMYLAYNETGTDALSDRMRSIPFKGKPTYTMSGKELTEIVKRTKFCIGKGKESTNQVVMSGMRVMATETGYVADATDGYVCAHVVLKNDGGSKAMSPAVFPRVSLEPMVASTRKEDEVQIIEGTQNAEGQLTKLFLRLGPSTFFGTRLLEGTFAPIQKALENHAAEFRFTVNREQLKQVLTSAGAFDAKNRLVRLEVFKTQLVIRAKGEVSELEEHLPIESQDLPDDLVVSQTIALDYLLNIASVSSQETLTIGISDYTQEKKQRKAVIVEDSDDNVESIYAIMPAVKAAA